MADDPGTQSAPEPPSAAAEPTRPADPPGEGTPTATPEPTPAPPDELDNAQPKVFQDAAAAVVFNVQGNMYADDSTIGGRDGRSGRSNTGTVDDDVLAEALRLFVDPPRFGFALDTLLRRRMVVLAGTEGSGRRCGGLALLKRAAIGGADQPAPVVLPPSWTVEKLAAYTFQKAGRYLLADQITDSALAAQRRFDLDAVLNRLKKANAILVITTLSAATTQGRFGDVAVAWEQVAGESILDQYLTTNGLPLPDTDVDRLRACVMGLAPHQVRRLLDRLEADGVQAAVDSTADAAREKVRTWLAGSPPLPELLPVVTAAIVHGATQRVHEHYCARLRSIVDEHAGRDPAAAEYTETLRPTRDQRSDLLAVRPPQRSPFDEPTIVVRSPEVHETVFRQLADRYGDELWAPVREWQLGLPEAAGTRTQLDLGFGTAVFARIDSAEVHRVVSAWADGITSERWTAAFTLHCMCADDRTAALALEIAIGWCWGAGPRRAVTAALAFALDLGIRYPSDAISRLWHLALRGMPVAGWAQLSMAALVSRAADEDSKRLRRALGIIVRQLRNLLDERPDDHRSIGTGLTTVSTVLTADAPDGEGSITLYILRRHPDLIAWIGELWAEVLKDSPHRYDAIDHLRDTFNFMHGVTDADAVAALGDAVLSHMLPEQWAWLCRDLPEGQWW